MIIRFRRARPDEFRFQNRYGHPMLALVTAPGETGTEFTVKGVLEYSADGGETWQEVEFHYGV